MTLQIDTLTLGPFMANAYIVADPISRECAIIDATWDAPRILAAIDAHAYTLRAIWLTHAHVDHIEAVPGVMDAWPGIDLGLHEDDYPLYQHQGGAQLFGFQITPGPKPNLWFDRTDHVQVGAHRFEVIFCPGHAPGHVAFYHRDSRRLFGGDVLFNRGIGRWDLPGANYAVLMQSIHQQFLTLPDDTIVYPGHGRPTTIGDEKRFNPFLN